MNQVTVRTTRDGVEKVIRLYQVLPAEANRKTAYLAIEDTWVTMIFPSDAVTIEDAENQFTDEADRLMSRSNNNLILNKETT